MSRLLFLLLSGLLFPLFLISQTTTPPLTPWVKHALHEKIRNGAHRAHFGLENTEEHEKQVSAKATNTRNSEIIISANAEAESEVHAVINPTDTNNIIVGAIIQNPTDPQNPLVFNTRYSTDFGNTWNTSSFNSNPEDFLLSLGGGDPVFAADADGKIYLSWILLGGSGFADIRGDMYLATSTDGGETFSAFPEKISSAPFSFTNIALADKQWMACDKSNSAFAGNLYVSYAFIESNGVDELTTMFVRTKSAGVDTLAEPVKVNSENYEFAQFASIDVDKDGAVHVIFTASNPSAGLNVYHTVSTDGGVTFSPEKIISPFVLEGLGQGVSNPIIGVDGARTYPCPHIAANPVTGNLVATWTAYGTSVFNVTDGYDIYYSTSDDGGATWSAAQTINAGFDDSAEQFYSALSYTPNGTLCVSYYDRSDDPMGANTHYRVAYSFDDGANFTPGINATTQVSDFSQIGSQNANFGIGEYNQIVATDNYAFPVWADGRTNDGNIEIYTARLPVTEMFVGVEEWGVIDANISIGPNPSNGLVQVVVRPNSRAELSIAVFGVDGKVLFPKKNIGTVEAGIEQIERLQLPIGVWFVQVGLGNQIRVKKVVVE